MTLIGRHEILFSYPTLTSPMPSLTASTLTVSTLITFTGNDVEIDGSPSMGSTGGSIKSMGGPSGRVSRSESIATGYEVEVEGSVMSVGGPSGRVSRSESIATGYEVEVEGSVMSVGGPSGLVSRSESIATGYEVEVEGSISGDEHD